MQSQLCQLMPRSSLLMVGLWRGLVHMTVCWFVFSWLVSLAWLFQFQGHGSIPTTITHGPGTKARLKRLIFHRKKVLPQLCIVQPTPMATLNVCLLSEGGVTWPVWHGTSLFNLSLLIRQVLLKKVKKRDIWAGHCDTWATTTTTN